ncbi:hypothetical protein M426DRAFT_12502 [Hypoxylon sp. CI-4A]|nr:hypothetical protein M426DRAFT_12502 [Hypoxylon sp. CI-4A]
MSISPLSSVTLRDTSPSPIFILDISHFSIPHPSFFVSSLVAIKYWESSSLYRGNEGEGSKTLTSQRYVPLICSYNLVPIRSSVSQQTRSSTFGFAADYIALVGNKSRVFYILPLYLSFSSRPVCDPSSALRSNEIILRFVVGAMRMPPLNPKAAPFIPGVIPIIKVTPAPCDDITSHQQVGSSNEGCAISEDVVVYDEKSAKIIRKGLCAVAMESVTPEVTRGAQRPSFAVPGNRNGYARTRGPPDNPSDNATEYLTAKNGTSPRPQCSPFVQEPHRNQENSYGLRPMKEWIRIRHNMVNLGLAKSPFAPTNLSEYSEIKGSYEAEKRLRQEKKKNEQKEKRIAKYKAALKEMEGHARNEFPFHMMDKVGRQNGPSIRMAEKLVQLPSAQYLTLVNARQTIWSEECIAVGNVDWPSKVEYIGCNGKLPEPRVCQLAKEHLDFAVYGNVPISGPEIPVHLRQVAHWALNPHLDGLTEYEEELLSYPTQELDPETVNDVTMQLVEEIWNDEV